MEKRICKKEFAWLVCQPEAPANKLERGLLRDFFKEKVLINLRKKINEIFKLLSYDSGR